MNDEFDFDAPGLNLNGLQFEITMAYTDKEVYAAVRRTIEAYGEVFRDLQAAIQSGDLQEALSLCEVGLSAE